MGLPLLGSISSRNSFSTCVIGEEELGETDKLYLDFGAHFEKEFLGQGPNEDRTIDQSLDLGWRLLSILPREELDRVDEAVLEQHYRKH